LAFGTSSATGTVVLSPSGASTEASTTAVAVNYGTLKLGNGNGASIITGAQGGLTVATNGTLDLNGNSVTAWNLSGGGNITNNSSSADATLTADNSGASTFGGTITDGSNGHITALTKSGTGTLTLSGANTYSGATTVNGGELLGGANNVFSASSAMTINTGGTVDLGGFSNTINSVALAGGTIQNGSLTGAITSSGGTINAIGGSASVEASSNKTTVEGSNGYTGATTIDNGATLAMTGTASIVSSSGVSNSGTFDISGLTNGGASIKTISGNGGVTLGSNTLTITAGGSSFGGDIGGSGGLTLNAPSGTFTLTASNDYTGATTITAGTLALSGSGSISDSSVVTANGTFDISGVTSNTLIKTLAGSGSVNLGGNNLVITAGSTTFSGAIGDGGNFGGIEISGGTQTLSGTNTYTNVTQIDTGATLALKGASAIADSAYVTFTPTGGGVATLDISQSSTGASVAGLYDPFDVGVVSLGSKTLTIGSAGVAFNGVIQDGGIGNGAGGAVTIAAGGDQQLGGTNTYTGLTTINATGELDLISNGAHNGSIATSSGLVDNGIFDISDLGHHGTTPTTTSIIALSGSAGAFLNLGENGLNLTNANGTFAGTIADGGNSGGTGGSLSIGGGTETLTGTNTYTGGTSITGGTLVVGNSSALGTGTVSMAAGTTLSFLNAANYTLTNKFQISGDPIFTPPVNTTQTISGTISNATGPAPAGIVDMEGAGTLVLSGTNSYSGGTIISAGTVQVTNDNSVGTGTVTLDGGTFQAGAAGLSFSNNFAINPTNGTIDTQAKTLTLSGTVADGTGSGALTKIGTGMLILTGTDTYSGGTTISAGTLQLGNGGSTGSIIGNVTDNGTLAVDTSATVTLSGTISGSGAFQQNGSGTTILSVLDSYGGATNVNSGTLEVNGSIAASSLTTVASGATLLGTGTVGNVQVNSHGTVTPGPAGGVGTLTVIGNLTLQSAAIYMVSINGAATSKANVTGTANITGATFAAAAGSTPVAGTDYLVLQSGAHIVGTFANAYVVIDNKFKGTLDYTTNPDDVYLDVTYYQLTSLLPSNLPKNLLNVATGIDNAILNGVTLPPGFANLFNFTPQQLENALTELEGQPATAAQRSAFQLMVDFLNLLSDPSSGGGSSPTGGGASGFAPEQAASFPSDIAEAYAAILTKAPPPQSFEQRWSAWASAFGGTSIIDGNAAAGTNTVTASDYGFAAGMDYRATPDSVYGFALAGGGTNWSVAQNLGGGRSDSFQIGIHQTTHWGPLYVSGALAFANHWFATNRIALGDQLTANFMGQSYAARGEAGYRYAVPVTGAIIGVTPYGALQAQQFHTPSFSETDLTGGGFALNFNAMTATDARSELGARFDNLQIVDDMPLVLRARVAWAHDWMSNSTLGAVFQALPGSNFIVSGVTPAANSALTTASGELHLAADWTMIAKFDGEFSATAQTYAGTGTLRYTW